MRSRNRIRNSNTVLMQAAALTPPPLSIIIQTAQLNPMRPKARGLAQHGGPPGQLEESDPAGVILYVTDGHHLILFHTLPVALTEAAQLHKLMEFPDSKCTQLSVMSYVTQGRHGLVLQQTHVFSQAKPQPYYFTPSPPFSITFPSPLFHSIPPLPCIPSLPLHRPIKKVAQLALLAGTFSSLSTLGGGGRREGGREGGSERLCLFYCTVLQYYLYIFAVLRIHDILVWIRIRIRGSMPLTIGSGSYYFRH